MKLILDSNIIIAAFATHGICHSIFEYCISNHEIYISEEILGEIEHNLASKIKLPDRIIKEIRTYLLGHCKISIPTEIESSKCRDESDLHILGLARNVMANIIISGDRDLLVLKEFEMTKIVSSREFWEMVKK